MFRLMLVTDRNRSRLPLPESVRLAIEGGVDAVQLRERDLEGDELFSLAEELRRITSDAGVALIVNHRADVALAVGADGVHLGWRSVGVEEVRRIEGNTLRVGVSCHSAEDVRGAGNAGADYAILGPVFFTPSKEGLVEPLGLDALSEIAAGAKLPLIAIGGITPQNIHAVRKAGVSGVAVISAILDSDDPRAVAQALVA